MNKAIGQRIKQLREHYAENCLPLRPDGTADKFTQTDLAAVMNVGQRTVSRWERGEIDFSPEQLVKLAQFFHVSVDYLLQGAEITELEFINQTGLSAKTVERLKQEKAVAADVHKMQLAIDLLCVSPAALTAILGYLTDIYPEEIPTPYNEKKVLTAVDLERVSRLAVMDELAALREKIWGTVKGS